MNHAKQHTHTTERQQPPAIRLHRDPNKAMQQMMDTIDRLRRIYEDETQALLNTDTKGFLALQNSKHDCALTYEAGIREILARKDELQDIDPKLKRKINKMQENFATLSQKNMEALQRMQRTMERLNNTILKAAKEEVKKQRVFSYGQHGHIKDDDKKHISIRISEEA